MTALAVDGSDLVAGGDFSTMGGVLAARVARWHDNSWSPMADGFPVTVAALARGGDGRIWAAGRFARSGGRDTPRIAEWRQVDCRPAPEPVAAPVAPPAKGTVGKSDKKAGKPTRR